MWALSGTHLSKSNSHWDMLLALAPGIGYSMEHMKVTPAWSANFLNFCVFHASSKQKPETKIIPLVEYIQSNTTSKLGEVDVWHCYVCWGELTFSEAKGCLWSIQYISCIIGCKANLLLHFIEFIVPPIFALCSNSFLFTIDLICAQFVFVEKNVKKMVTEGIRDL